MLDGERYARLPATRLQFVPAIAFEPDEVRPLPCCTPKIVHRPQLPEHAKELNNPVPSEPLIF